jgi:hypothetical protein
MTMTAAMVRDGRSLSDAATILSLTGKSMGNLRTGNKRRNRAMAALQSRKKLADAEPAVVAKADVAAS